MGCKKREMLCGEKIKMIGGISNALLYATMSIVGFPVHAFLNDNSVFFGIFFTASFHYNNSGIVLKNAKMIKKGKSAANVGSVGSGSVIETLVVRFADLLQVVAKGNALPENAVACNIEGDPFKIVVDRQNEEAPSPRGNERQAAGDKPLRELVNCEKMPEIRKKEIKDEVHGSLLAVDSRIAQSKSVEKVVSDLPCKLPPKGDASDHPLSSSDKLDEQSQSRCSSQNSAHSDGVPSRSSTPRSSTETDHKESPTSKVSKLNPGAKLFCPSVTKPPTPPVVPIVANVAYVPDNYSMGPIASHQQEVDMNPFLSLSAPPTKFIPYVNLVAGTGFTDPQYSQSFNGSMDARTQAVGCGGQQVHPTYAVPSCVTSNAQHVMVGRGGQQLIYMHPLSHDMNQATAAFSQVSLQPSQTPPVAHYLKHQGNVAAQTLQLYVNPPFMPVGQQQIAVQGHPYLSPPPFSVLHPTPTQGATTGFFTPKFT